MAVQPTTVSPAEVLITDASHCESVMARATFGVDVKLDIPNEQAAVRHSCATLGSTSIVRFECEGGAYVQCDRRWPQIRQDNAHSYLVWFPIVGSVSVLQNGNSREVLPQHSAIGRWHQPFRVRALHDSGGRHLSYLVNVPAHVVRSLVPGIESWMGNSFSIASDSGYMARITIMESFLHATGMSPDVSQGFVLAALRATFDCHGVTSYSNPPATPSHTVRAIDILKFIDCHLAAPDLMISTVAKAFGISTSYVYALLRTEGLSFQKYVWDERFRQAHDRICDPRFAHEPIATIAFEAGFSSSAHFSRSFRQRFGMSPRALRKISCQTPQSAAAPSG